MFRLNKKIIGYALLITVFALVPLFVHSPYYLDLVIIIILNTMLAMSFIILLKTGLISLAIAAFWGIGVYTSAILATKCHLSFWVCLPVTVLITGVFAFMLGFFLLKNVGFSFVMLTAVIGMLFTVTVGNITFLGGYNGISNVPPPSPIKLPFLPLVEFTSKTPFLYLALFLFLVVILINAAMNSAWIGRAWTAIGLNRQLAESVGINIFRYKLIAFVFASAILGLVGSFYAHYEGYVFPDTFGIWTVVYIQIYAVLGGIGFPVMGPLVGSVIMTFFPELIRITREIAPIFVGILLILLIMFLPNGLLSLQEKWPTLISWFSKRIKRGTLSRLT
jgi:branched-chain amino acid transport system permease protein